MWDDSIGSWAWPQDSGAGRVDTRKNLPGVPTSKGSQVPGKLSGLSGIFKQEGVAGFFQTQGISTHSLSLQHCVSLIFCRSKQKRPWTGKSFRNGLAGLGCPKVEAGSGLSCDLI